MNVTKHNLAHVFTGPGWMATLLLGTEANEQGVAVHTLYTAAHDANARAACCSGVKKLLTDLRNEYAEAGATPEQLLAFDVLLGAPRDCDWTGFRRTSVGAAAF